MLRWAAVPTMVVNLNPRPGSNDFKQQVAATRPLRNEFLIKREVIPREPPGYLVDEAEGAADEPLGRPRGRPACRWSPWGA
jgi:hypothetical protein